MLYSIFACVIYLFMEFESIFGAVEMRPIYVSLSFYMIYKMLVPFLGEMRRTVHTSYKIQHFLKAKMLCVKLPFYVLWFGFKWHPSNLAITTKIKNSAAPVLMWPKIVKHGWTTAIIEYHTTRIIHTREKHISMLAATPLPAYPKCKRNILPNGKWSFFFFSRIYII